MASFEIPGYELYELLGRGGMATVYRALHLNLDREVAIKVMDTALNSDTSFSERFIREARISARLVHPHILQIYDVNAFETLNYISMELLEGGDLAENIRGSLKQSVIYTVIKQMTDALDYAANKGYVHRDIKPSNIMIRGDGDYVLADFGIAKAANSGTQMTQTGLMVGTPSYMSPEQAKGIEIDGRSDLYSLSVLCYEMLTKELPYDSDSAVSTAVKHLTEDIPTLPDHLAAYQPFIDKALAKKAEDRYQSGREMYAGFSEVRDQFDDDAVLTEGKVLAERGRSASGGRRDSGTEVIDSRTSLSWDDSTRVYSSQDGGGRPYRLSDTSPREPLVSGIRNGQTPARRRSGRGVGIFAALALVLAAGYGGYQYWQNQQGAASTAGRETTSELAAAYGALNQEDYQKAAIAFRKVLSLDSGNAAASSGLDEVEKHYVSILDAALRAGDLAKSRRQLTDFSLLFPNNGDIDRFQSALQQAEQDQQIKVAQSERVDVLLKKAADAMAAGQLFAPVAANTYTYLDQARALERNNLEVNEAMHALMAQAVAQVSVLVDAGDFADARDMLNRVRDIDQGYPALVDALANLDRAEQANLARQARWATYSPEKQQQILERVAAAEQLLADGKLTAAEETAPGENAQAAFASILELDPESHAAVRGPERIVRAYITLSEQAVAQAEFDKANEALTLGASVLPDYPDLQRQGKAVTSARKAYARRAEKLEQVNTLLAQADSEVARLSEGQVFADRAVDVYSQVLALDPDNTAASAALESLAEHYANDAAAAAEQGQFSLAAAAIDKALNLAPDSKAYAKTRASLSEQESQWLAGQGLADLLSAGQQQVSDGDLTGAADTFASALKLDPTSTEASDALAAAIASLLARAQTGIASGEFVNAGADLAAAALLTPGREDIVQLQAQLPELEANWEAQQSISAELASAAGLYKAGQLSNAAAAYNALAQQYPDSSEASAGLNKSLAGLIKSARSSAASGQFDKARINLAAVMAVAPDDKGARKLEAELPAMEKTYQQQQAAAAQAVEEAKSIADSGFMALESGDLDTASGAYQQLQQNHPTMKETSRLKQQLVSAYVESTRTDITNGDFDAAEASLRAGQQLSPGYSTWEELAEEIAVSRNSSRRRLGAY